VSGPEFQFYDLHATMMVAEGGRILEQGITPPVCDFCMDTRVRWDYPCEDFVIDSLEYGSVEGWAACDRCSALVEADERGLLAERSLESWRLRGMPAHDELSKGVREMQAGFFANRVGERVAFG